MDLTFEELYRGHHADVYRVALRELGNPHDAEDVTQAAFVDAYRAVVRGTQPQSPRAWLLAISENVRRRRFRTSQRRVREEPIDADFPLAAELPYEQAGALAEALAALPTEQRHVFVLRELAGLSYDEIADEVGSTVPAIQMLLFRARRSLRDELDPPAVSRRRTGLIVPVPGWFTGLLSRVEVTGLTPRAAGALGAAALAFVGASVAVPTSEADRRDHPQAAAQPRVARAADPAPARLIVRPTAARVTKEATAGSRTVVRSKPKAQPAQRSHPVTTLPPSFVPVPVPAPAPAPVAVPVQATPQAVPMPQPSRVPITPLDEAVREPVELPVPPTVPLPTPPPVSLPVSPPASLPVSPPVSLPVRPPVTLPVPPPVPPVVSIAPVEGATGAAGAAGASAPPVPVPSLPPGTLPPAP